MRAHAEFTNNGREASRLFPVPTYIMPGNVLWCNCTSQAFPVGPQCVPALFPLKTQTMDFCSVTGTPPWVLEMQELEVNAHVRDTQPPKIIFLYIWALPYCNDEILGFFWTPFPEEL